MFNWNFLNRTLIFILITWKMSEKMKPTGSALHWPCDPTMVKVTVWGNKWRRLMMPICMAGMKESDWILNVKVLPKKMDGQLVRQKDRHARWLNTTNFYMHMLLIGIKKLGKNQCLHFLNANTNQSWSCLCCFKIKSPKHTLFSLNNNKPK